MEQFKVYLETTMFSFYYEERDKPGYMVFRSQVQETFAILRAAGCEIYSSVVTIDELSREPNLKKQEKTALLFDQYGIIILKESERADRLAQIFLDEKVVPEGSLYDASHMAIATVSGLDFIVSLNFEHIVRPWTIERVRRINLREGFRPIGIFRPDEVREILEL
jgi:hypothetical protein